MPSTPFVFGRVADKENFIDRDAEREHLSTNFRSGVNTILLSPRRWGKTSLIQRVCEDLAPDKGIRTCQIDLFNCRSEADFYAHLATGVLRATTSRIEEWAEAVGTFMTHLRPKVSISPDPTQTITLDMDWRAAERDPDDVLDLAEHIAESRKKRLVVCIDEFQAIAGFTDAVVVQQKLRSHWQRHQHVTYCLYGSKRHMLLDLFSDPDLPFYRFGDIMLLGKIDNAVWGDFIVRRFADTGKAISADRARAIAAAVDNHSYYVQQLAQQVWFRTEGVCTDDAIAAALDGLVNQLSLLFTGLADSLSARQLGYLRALNDGVSSLSAQATLRAYDLGTSANVTRLKAALLGREIIDVEDGAVRILDPLFARWLRTVT